MKGRIVLIEPKAPNLHIFSGMSLPRLGTILLGTIARDLGWDVEVIIEEQHPVDWRTVREADLVGVSTITSTAPRAYAIADRAREYGTPVIMGGPHVTFLPEEALGHCDWVMIGEGETAFPLFLETLRSHGDWTKVPNLAWRQGGELRRSEANVPFVELDSLPAPDFSLVKGETLYMSGKRVVPVQTSRGCPFDCSFCSVTGMFGRKFRYRSVEMIMEELRELDDGRTFVFFYDDNFMANTRHARELLDAMEREEFRFTWSAQVRADLARDPEMVARMKRAGCHTVFIGFESVNPATLKTIRKKASVDDMTRAAQVFRHNGINVHGMFILGLDDDDRKTVRQTVRFAKRNLISTAQFLILTPLPGTSQYEELKREGRILFGDWSLYDAHHVVYRPKNFTVAALQRAQITAHRAFYSVRETVRRALRLRIVDVVIAHYARGLNRNWRRKNRTFLKLLNLLKPRRDAAITADFRQTIDLDDKPSGKDSRAA